MNRISRISVIVVVLAVSVSYSLARSLDSVGYSDSGSNADSSLIGQSEYHDLSSAGNTPTKNIDDKKRMKNSAGKSDEGGFHKTYGSDAEGEKGYLKRTYSKGDHGYKTLDTFHKKDGDNYGFEEHTAFGKARGRDKGGRGAKSGSYTTKANDGDDHDAAGTIVDTHYVEQGGDNAGEAAEVADSGESASYSDGGDGGHYGSDGDSGHYGEGDTDAGNYGNSDGYSEVHSTEGGDDGTYGSSSSYSSDGEGGGDYY